MNMRVFLLILLLFSAMAGSHAWGWWRRHSSRTPTSGTPSGTRTRGVTANKLANSANYKVGSKSWNYYGCKGGLKYCFSNKCNLFVYDMLKSVNAKSPNRKSKGYYPIGANEWGNPRSSYIRSTGCYRRVYSKQAGDIIAFPRSGKSGHVGIVYSKNEYISAGTYRIKKTGYPKNVQIFCGDISMITLTANSRSTPIFFIF